MSEAQQEISVTAQRSRYSAKKAENEEQHKRNIMQLLEKAQQENNELKHEVAELQIQKDDEMKLSVKEDANIKKLLVK